MTYKIQLLFFNQKTVLLCETRTYQDFWCLLRMGGGIRFIRLDAAARVAASCRGLMAPLRILIAAARLDANLLSPLSKRMAEVILRSLSLSLSRKVMTITRSVLLIGKQ